MNGKSSKIKPKDGIGYGDLVSDIGELLEAARRTTTRSVNAIMTATYWEIGRRIVEFEQGGAERAQYGKGFLKRLSGELIARFGRGFSRHNLARFRSFYLLFPLAEIRATLSLKSREDSRRGDRLNAPGVGEEGDRVVNVRSPMGVGSVNRGLSMANIERRNTIIPVLCFLARRGRCLDRS